MSWRRARDANEWRVERRESRTDAIEKWRDARLGLTPLVGGLSGATRARVPIPETPRSRRGHDALANELDQRIGCIALGVARLAPEQLAL